MGRVLTNNVSMAFAVEASIGVLPGSPTWKTVEPNSISGFGSSITKVAREPISPLRQRRKGTTVDLDSAAEWEGDLTLDHFNDFIEGFVFASAQYTDNQPPIRSGALFQNLAADNDPPPAGTDAGFTHSALAAAILAGRLVYPRGFANAANSGMREVLAGSTTTATLVSGVLVDETPSNQANASLEMAGVRGAVGDLTLTVTGLTGVLGSTVLNLTTLELTVGQVIHIGGLLSANQFTNGKGFARISSIAAAAIGLVKLDPTLITDTGAGKQIDILFGAFIRNVATTASNFIERSYQFELALPNLQVPGPGDEYEYAKGNFANQVTFNLPLTEKATAVFGFVGTDTEVPTTSRKTNAATPQSPVQTTALNTTNDIARLRIQKVDETGITTCFKNVSLILNNQVSPEKCLGTLGAVFMNTGNFLVNLDAEILLTDSRVVAAIRNNETVTFDFILRNGDGAIAVDIPSMTLGGGEKGFPLNESVTISLAGEAFVDSVLGYSVGVSTFPAVPLA